MSSRAGRILLIAFQVLFLNVVVPGHTRGVITLSGRSSSPVPQSSGCGGCCPTRGDPADAPTEEDKANCAVCFFAARITPPPVVDFQLTMLGLREVMPLPPRAVVVTPDLPVPYDGRAPPAA